MNILNTLRAVFNTFTYFGNITCREYWGTILIILFLLSIALTIYLFSTRPNRNTRVTVLGAYILAIIFGFLYTVDSVINFGQDIISPTILSILTPTFMFGVYSAYARLNPNQIILKICLALLFGIATLFYIVFFVGMCVFSIYGLVNWGSSAY